MGLKRSPYEPTATDSATLGVVTALVKTLSDAGVLLAEAYIQNLENIAARQKAKEVAPNETSALDVVTSEMRRLLGIQKPLQ